jgi:hypothetical protein
MWVACGDGNGEPSPQYTPGSVHPALDTRRTTSRVGQTPMTPMTPMPNGLGDAELAADEEEAWTL